MSYQVDFTPEQLALKAKFAAALLEAPDANPFIAAKACFPDSMPHALWAANHWPTDEGVLKEKQKIREKGEDLKGLPGKADLARRIWGYTEQGLFEDRLKALKLYAEVMGHVQKVAPVAVNVNNNKVMVIRDQGSDAQWEDKVAKQQEALLHASNTRH